MESNYGKMLLPIMAIIGKTILIGLLSLNILQAKPITQSNIEIFPDHQSVLTWFDQTEIQLEKNHDQRLIFLKVYREITNGMIEIQNSPKIKHPEWINNILIRFASLYKNAFDCYETKTCNVSRAWRKAFNENELNKQSSIMQLMFSMNAHIMRDLPLAVAQTIPVINDPSYRSDYKELSIVFEKSFNNLIIVINQFQKCHLNKFENQLVKTTILDYVGFIRSSTWSNSTKLFKSTNTPTEVSLMFKLEDHVKIYNRFLELTLPLPAQTVCY